VNRRPEDRLEDAILHGSSSGDSEIDGMATAAASLRSAFVVAGPPASDVEAMFVSGIASAGRRPPFSRLVGPIALGTAVLLVLALAGRQALPGHRLYSVRQILSSVGLADSAEKEAADRLQDARGLVVAAEALPPGDRAQGLAVEAIGELGVVRELAKDIDESDATELLDDVASLERRAARVIAASDPDLDDKGSKSDGIGGSNGNSDDGPASGDDDPNDPPGTEVEDAEPEGSSGGNDGSDVDDGDDVSGNEGDDGLDTEDGKDGPGGDHNGSGGSDDDGEEVDGDTSGDGDGDASESDDDLPDDVEPDDDSGSGSDEKDSEED
jgi:hypothetical protein